MTQQRGILPSTGWAGTLSVVDGEPGWVLEGKGLNKLVQSPHYIPLLVPPRGPAKGERPLLTPIRGNANRMPRLLTHSEGPLPSASPSRNDTIVRLTCTGFIG